MRRRYIYFLLTYFHNSSKKEHITKYSIKSTITALKRPICQARRLPRRPVSSNGPAATPLGNSSLARRLTRHVLVRPKRKDFSRRLQSRTVLYTVKVVIS